jgi:two-component system, OmpR family, sensor histidine kinase ArlS
MQLKTRLNLLFTIITTAIVLVFSAVIYYSADKDREREFFDLLSKEAITKANLVLDARVEPETLQDIYLRNREIINEVEVAIYDDDFNLLYHDAIAIDFVKETREMNDDILAKGEIRFSQEGWQVIGIRFPFRGNDYVLTAAAYDGYGYSKLESLRATIIWLLVISIMGSWIVGHFLSEKAFRPIQQMISQARQITATNLDLRIPSKENNDELSQLAGTFNDMLDRLEKSFDAQKQFVSNISHELRTPLASIIAELELSDGKARNTVEYMEAIRNALADARKLKTLSNGLLDMAKASYDPAEIKFRKVRVDEVLLDARHQVQKIGAGYRININFTEDIEDDNQVSVNGNEYLLKVAFSNLFDNGCKFSENMKCAVSISFSEKDVMLDFTDEGIGIKPEEIDQVFKPFFRGANRNFSDGHGIGLPLSQKIIHLHKGSISVSSVPGKGTNFTVTLPRITEQQTEPLPSAVHEPARSHRRGAGAVVSKA